MAMSTALSTVPSLALILEPCFSAAAFALGFGLVAGRGGGAFRFAWTGGGGDMDDGGWRRGVSGTDGGVSGNGEA